MCERVNIMVATVAFGMGINKTNVRFVFHDIMAKSLDDYMQEIGRAGRDGIYAQCTIFYQVGDLQELEWVITANTQINEQELKEKNMSDFEIA